MLAARAVLVGMLDRDRARAKPPKGESALSDAQRDAVIDIILLACVAAGVCPHWRRTAVAHRMCLTGMRYWDPPSVEWLVRWLRSYGELQIECAWPVYDINGSSGSILFYVSTHKAMHLCATLKAVQGPRFVHDIRRFRPEVLDSAAHGGDGGALWSPVVHGAWPRERRARVVALFMMLRASRVDGHLGWLLLRAVVRV